MSNTLLEDFWQPLAAAMRTPCAGCRSEGERRDGLPCCWCDWSDGILKAGHIFYYTKDGKRYGG